MAAAAILNWYFVTVDHPRSLLHGPNIVLKFHVNRITTAWHMAIWKFCKFGLKRQNLRFWGFWPPNIIFRHRDPKRHFLGGNRVVWAIKRRDRSSCLIGTAWQEYKKKQRENQWRDKLGIGPAHTLNPILTIFGMWGGLQDVFLSFEFRVDRSPNFGATGCQKSPLPID